MIVLFQTLRLSSTARRKKTVGEIINLMAIDVEMIQVHYFERDLNNEYIAADHTSSAAVLVLSIPGEINSCS